MSSRKQNKNIKKLKKVEQKVKKEVKEVKEMGLGRKIMRGVGSVAGGIFGSPSFGEKAGDFLATITGMGDYKVKNNSFMKSSSDVPTFQHLADGSVIVTHREFVSDIQASLNFNLYSYVVNPSNFSLFPVLSAVASTFEQYEFLGLVFAYRERSGEVVNGTNTALGTVIMATEYDLSRPNFVSKQEMESYEFSVSCAPNKDMLHPVECNPKQDILNARYTQAGLRNFAGSQDTQSVTFNVENSLINNLSDLGRFQMAVVGCQGSSGNIGELWVTYHCKLSKPRYQSLCNRGGLFHATSGPLGTNGCASGSGPFGLLPQVCSDSTQTYASVSIESHTTLRIGGLQAGECFTFNLLLVSSQNITISISVSASGCTNLAQNFPAHLPGAGSNLIQAGNGTVTTSLTGTYIVNSSTTPANSVTLTFGTVTVATGAAFDFDLRVFPANPTPSIGFLGVTRMDELSAKITKLEKLLMEKDCVIEYDEQEEKSLSLPRVNLPPPPFSQLRGLYTNKQ